MGTLLATISRLTCVIIFLAMALRIRVEGIVRCQRHPQRNGDIGVEEKTCPACAEVRQVAARLLDLECAIRDSMRARDVRLDRFENIAGHR